MSFRTAENENLLHTWNYSSLENGELTIGSTITLTDNLYGSGAGFGGPGPGGGFGDPGAGGPGGRERPVN